MSDPTNQNNADRDPFYVGYLPLPAAIKRFIVPWVVGNFVLALGIAAVAASQHREPGDGKWETNELLSLSGRITMEPYPILRTDLNESYLLVEQGKIGAQKRLSQYDLLNEPFFNVNGYLIERDGRRIIEIDATHPDPVEPVWIDYPTPIPVPVDLGTHTLRGEIVDPKCYLGVMQPGEGKTHKVCATLCISGGIPPMLLVRDKQGNTAAYLVTDEQGQPFPASHYEYIADPIEVTGRVIREGDLLILRADLASIRRLSSDRP